MIHFFLYNMDKFNVLKVIWSIDIWKDVHILVRTLNWLSVKRPLPLEGCYVVH